ncbi:MAG: NAD-dependent epimerase/dehydratase family protein [Alphaproteobacteria bacterium]
MSTATARVALVGAGFISDVHAQALAGLPSVSLAAVVERDPARAEALAGRWKIPQTFGDVDALIAARACDVAHVLVPPAAHRAVAAPLLEAGIDVLLEKPMGVSAAECEALLAAAEAGKARLGVNQNFVFNPAFVRLRKILDSGELGELRHLGLVYNMPLRQLSAGQFGHWMFQAPQNILLEQAVHPLSLIQALVGSADELSASASPPRELGPGQPFYERFMVASRHGTVTAQSLFAFGQDYPAWRVQAICRDGIVHADVLANRVTVERASRWPEFFDFWQGGTMPALSGLGQATGNMVGDVLSLLKLRGRSDPFFVSMKGSIGAFHASRQGGALQSDGRFGGDLIGLCEQIADAAGIEPPAAAPAVTRTESWDVAVLGGTGFIGQHVVAALRAQGHKVGVMSRSASPSAAVFADPDVAIVTGDVHRREDIERAIGQARLVVNLAQGAQGGSADEIQQSMIDSACLVGEVCLDKGVEMLVHTGTIASLQLGDPSATITGETPTDPEPEKRAVYSRGKGMADNALLRMHRERGLPVCILRPGLVVGEGGLAFHSGLGFFNRERHTLGWNQGRNPLPFVLVEDVAAAVAGALNNADAANGKAYNLVGDVRLSARAYVEALGKALRRPLRFHGHSVGWLQSTEVFKWLVKQAIGRRDAPYPSIADLRSRGLMARFDCADAKRDLGWSPVSDHATFVRRAIDVHGPIE